jgi:ABC-type sugar transport system, periplasmic component
VSDSSAFRPDRRTFLSFAGLGALTLLGAGSLAGCGSQTALKVSNAADANLPRFMPLKGLTPDLPGTAAGVPAGFYNYPKNPFRSVTSAPLKGETITAITNIFGPPPSSRTGNPAWQAVEKRLGGTVDITSVSSDDFDTKFNTVVAGGDLPDLMLNDGAAIPDIIGFLQSKCQDLTPFLAGEKIADYPNLAAIPQVFWEQCVKNGKIYELPIPRSMTGGSGFINKTYFDEAGVTDTGKIKSADDYFALLKQLTSSSANRWALGSTNFGTVPFMHIFNVPYNWKYGNGKLTKSFETEEYLEAIGFAQKAYQAGLYVPGSEGWTKSQMSNAFISGKVAQIYDGLPAYAKTGGYAHTVPQANPKNVAAPFIPFGHDGGKPITWLDNIVFAATMVKKGSAAHINKVLGVANFLAAPFGSEEYLLLNYGVAGADYSLDAHGNPVSTQQSVLDTAVPWKYLAAPTQVVYDATARDAVTMLHDAYSRLVPLGVQDPCATLFSPTDAQKGQTIAQPVTDAVTNYIAGRGTLDAVKAAIKTWKTSGGDTIRSEYQKALSKSKTASK